MENSTSATMTGMDAQFLNQQLQECIRRTFRKQYLVAVRKIYSKRKDRNRPLTGRLKEALDTPSFTTRVDEFGVEGHTVYPMYIRFLDMRGKSDMRIYNRPIWQTFYRDTLARIRREFDAWMATIPPQVEKALP